MADNSNDTLSLAEAKALRERLDKTIKAHEGAAEPGPKSIFKTGFNFVRGIGHHVVDTAANTVNRINAEVEERDKLNEQKRMMKEQIEKEVDNKMKAFTAGQKDCH